MPVILHADGSAAIPPALKRCCLELPLPADGIDLKAHGSGAAKAASIDQPLSLIDAALTVFDDARQSASSRLTGSGSTSDPFADWHRVVQTIHDISHGACLPGLMREPSET